MPLRRFAFLAVLLLAGCGIGGPGGDAPAHEAAHSIIVTYQVPAMLAQAAPIISDSLKSNLPAQVDAQRRQQLQKAVRAAFDSDRLTADLTRRLQAAAEDGGKTDDLVHAAETLDAKLPRRMIALEDAAADEDFAKGFREFLQSSPPDDGEPRMQHVRKLARNMQLVELQTGFNVGMLRGMVRARNAAAPEAYRTSDETMRRMIKETRDGMHQRLNGQLPIMLFYAYREVPDAKVAEYDRLQSDPALQWVNGQIARAVEQTLSGAAEDVAERYRNSAEAAGET